MFLTGSVFHDDDYDGVVIKIPRALISMNGMQGVYNEFRGKLDKYHKLSRAHPDFIRSLYELDNYEDKSAHIAEQKKRQKARRQADTAARRSRFDKEILDVLWMEYKGGSSHTDLSVLGRHFSYDYIMTTRKRSIRIQAREEIESLLRRMTTTEQAKEFFNDNGFEYLSHIIQGMTIGEHWRWPIGKNILYEDNYGNLTVRIDKLGIQYYVSMDRYIATPIGPHNVKGREDHGVWVFSPRTDKETLFYSDYINKGSTLIKITK